MYKSVLRCAHYKKTHSDQILEVDFDQRNLLLQFQQQENTQMTD